MVNEKTQIKTTSVSCFTEDKRLLEAMCFAYKMKQNELVSKLINDYFNKVLESDSETAELIIKMCKNNEKI